MRHGKNGGGPRANFENAGLENLVDFAVHWNEYASSPKASARVRAHVEVPAARCDVRAPYKIDLGRYGIESALIVLGEGTGFVHEARGKRGAKLGDGGDAPFREPAERRDGILLGP